MKRKFYSCLCYNNIDPEHYEARCDGAPFEKYLREHWYPLIIAAFGKHCKNKIVLDLGCGTGTYSDLISRDAAYVLGIDLSRRMLYYAKKKHPNLSLVLADAHHIPLKPNFVDTIVCIGLFEYVERARVLLEISRVLKSSGVCIVQCPNKYSAARMPYKMICRIRGREYYCKEPSLMEMLNLFKQYGFKILEWRMDDGLIWLPEFLDKRIGRKIYLFLEGGFKIFGRNPFSNVMLFVVENRRCI